MASCFEPVLLDSDNPGLVEVTEGLVEVAEGLEEKPDKSTTSGKNNDMVVEEGEPEAAVSLVDKVKEQVREEHDYVKREEEISEKELIEDPDYEPSTSKKPKKSPTNKKKFSLKELPGVDEEHHDRLAETRLPLGPSHRVLWNLLLALLRCNRKKTRELITWTDVSTLTFHIRRSEKLARMWGKAR